MAVYVMSDLHGLKHRFDQMLENIAFSKKDTLYILGDVIDRGPDGVALIQTIKAHKNMHLLMGNHEHMMIEYMDAKENYDQGKDILESMMIMRRWDLNHNETTKAAFYALSQKEQKAILTYLKKLPLAYPNVEVKGQRFCLVHAMLHPFAYQEKMIDLAWCKKNNIDPYCFLWERNEGDFQIPPDVTLVFGHTITGFYQMERPYAIWTACQDIQTTNVMDIDCGCAANNSETRLCCVRLDDREVFYE